MSWEVALVSHAIHTGASSLGSIHRSRAGSRVILRGLLPMTFLHQLRTDLLGQDPEIISSPESLQAGVFDGSWLRLCYQVDASHVQAFHKVYGRQLQALQFKLASIVEEASYGVPLVLRMEQKEVSNLDTSASWMGAARAWWPLIQPNPPLYQEEDIEAQTRERLREAVDMDERKDLYLTLDVDWREVTEGSSGPDPTQHEAGEDHGFTLDPAQEVGLVCGAGPGQPS